MTELTDLANSIANSKEQIRQAIEDRGMECGVEVPLADYANKIRNMTVSNKVDSLYAVNYTGATISEGDKVFLNKKGLDSTSSFMTTKSSSEGKAYICLVDPSGNVTWQSYNGYIYDTNTGNIIGSSAKVSGSSSSNSLGPCFPKYDSYGRMYWKNYVFQNGVMSERSTVFINNDYDIQYVSVSNYKSIKLYKMNRKTNEVIKTITLNSQNSMSTNYQPIMINNNVYIAYYDNSSGTVSSYVKFTINDTDLEYNALIITNSNYNVFNYLTPDNKYCFRSYPGNESSSPLAYQTYVYEIRNDNFYQLKVFNNPKLADILNNRCWLCFNEQTGILCAMKNDNTAFGVFKYEDNDFTTIPIEISASQIPQNNQCAGMSISDDFSTLNIRDRTFKLEQGPDGSYKAISYSNGLTEDVLTGIAQSNAENGERFEVITLFPPEIATTVRVKVEGNEPADVTETIME